MEGEDIPRSAGRTLFGLDAAAYAVIRPEYPDWVYNDINRARTIAGTTVLEIGPGTGQATRALIRHGASRLTLLEPDARMHPMLEDVLQHADVSLQGAAFEEAALAETAYDLIVAATSFHWLDQASGLARARSLLTPGGVVALIWNTFQVLGAADPFHEATVHLLAPLSRSPSAGASPRASPSASPGDSLPFALDHAARHADARAAGFARASHRHETWALTLDPGGVRQLYGGFSNLLRLPNDEREIVLTELERIATRDFDSRVVRNMTTSLYLLSD